MKYIYSIILGLIFFVPQITLFAQDLYFITPININTREFVEESAVYYKNGIVFVSNRAQSALRSITDQNLQPLNDIFFSRLKDNKKFAAPDLFSKELKTRMHEGAICFDTAGKTAYFTRVEESSHAVLYSATLNGNDWVNITPLPFNLNNYSFTDPCLSHDGKKLFFSSNRPGGQGGFDIWVSNLGRNGWGPAKNLGPIVNSDSSEFCPFIHPNGKLYFASRRKGAIGGVDIYWTKEINGHWLPPKLLPAPLNTKYNDYSYVSDSADRNGFISSDRNKSNDIFSFTLNFPQFHDPKPILKNTYKYRFRETSVISDSSTYLYEWDFGDSTKIRGRSLDVRHTFPKTGDYLVKLNVIDSLTGDVYLNQSANVMEVRDEKQPVISCPDTVFTGMEIIFNSDKSYLPDFKSPEYYWDLGDGTLEKGKSIKHMFVYPGEYKVLLGVLDRRKDQESPVLVSVFKKIIVLEAKKNP
jgi:hypothetical protein